MPLQNRVTPLSELIADPARGLVYGNRGCLHDDSGQIRRRWATKRWIACRLEFRGWQRGPLLQPGKFTELFFLDEATAFAAGHRPCALCRREDYVRFGELFRGATGADAIDEQLHHERVDPVTRERRLHETALENSSGRRVRPRRRRAVARPRQRAPPLDAIRLRRAKTAPPRQLDPDHAAVTRRDPPRRLGGRSPAPPPDRAYSCAEPAQMLMPLSVA